MTARKKRTSERPWGQVDYSAVLRVGGARFDVDAFLLRWPKVRPDKVFRVGEPYLRKRRHQENGFNLNIARGKRWEAGAVRRIETFLKRFSDPLDDLNMSGAKDTQIDIGLFIGPMSPGTVYVPPRLLQQLAQKQIALLVTSYPCSDA